MWIEKKQKIIPLDHQLTGYLVIFESKLFSCSEECQIFDTLATWICYNWNNCYTTKISHKKQFLMYSC